MPFTVVLLGVIVDSLRPTAFSAAGEPFMLIAVPFVVFSVILSSLEAMVACTPAIPASFMAFSRASAFCFEVFVAAVAGKFIFLPFMTRSSFAIVSEPASTALELKA